MIKKLAYRVLLLLNKLSLSNALVKEAREMLYCAEFETDINKKAARQAYDFSKTAIHFVNGRKVVKSAFMDLHPNGYAMVVFRRGDAIISFLFKGEDKAQWASYFEGRDESLSGYFKVGDGLPEEVGIRMRWFAHID